MNKMQSLLNANDFYHVLTFKMPVTFSIIDT